MDFEDILLEIINDVGDGRKIDIEKYCKKYPHYKKELLVKLRVAEFIKRNLQEDDFGGRKFGEYIILQELSRGGMGIVFLAIQPSLSRLVTIKILPPHFAYDKDALKNFHEEAKTVAKFNHPNIVPIYSLGEEGGINYIAMNYIAGSSLKDMVEHIKTMGKIHSLKADDIRNIISTPPLEKQDITQQSITLKRDFNFWNKPYFQFIALVGNEISEAINYAHQSGICHGDIKLSNILLTKELIPMIVDFGLSKDLRKSSSKSKEFAGTFVYAAPEQIRENIINEKTDIWSLGVTLYELLTLKNPFIDKNVEKMMAKILKSEVTPLRALNKKIPVELEAIVLKCLEKKPENRYNSALELSQDLNNYLESKPIKAKPITIIGRTKKWAKRHPILTSIIGIIMLLSSVVGYARYIEILINRGFELAAMGNWEQSKILFEQILKFSPRIPLMRANREQAFLGLANFYLSKGQNDKAFQYYEKCLEIFPDNIFAHLGMGFIYEYHGYYDEALRCAEQVLALESDNKDGIELYAMVLRGRGLRDEALEFLAKKCKLEKIANDPSIQKATYRIIDDIIFASTQKRSFENIKQILISKGFDEKYAEIIVKSFKENFPKGF